MAKDQSFDVVSQVNIQEIDNAVTQAKKELSQRYDLKDSGSSINYYKNESIITIIAPSDFVISQIKDLLTTKLIRRKVNINSLVWGKIESSSSGNVKQSANIIEGIDRDTASKINKDIKSTKLKVKVIIEKDKLRVSSPKRDTLQEVISYLSEKDYGIPLQFVNYR